MTKTNKRFLAAAAALLILLSCLSAGCRKQPEVQPTEPAAVQGTPSVYTVELCSDSGYPLEGVGVYVYTDATQQELVWFARTDAEGKITFRDVTCEGYIAIFDGVSSDYIVEESYPLTGEHTKVVVAAQMQSSVDLSTITRKLGDVMFDFTITSSDGVEYTLSELLKEKDAVVLNFWYLNCAPCRQEFPYLQEAYEEYSDKIEVLAMNPVDGTDEKIAVFKKELGLTFPMATCEPEWASAMQLTAYPTTVIIDRYGVISLIHAGSITASKVFTDAFAYFTAEDYVQGTVENIEDLETEAPGSNSSEPIELGGVTSFEATVPAGGKIYYHLYRVDGTLTITQSNIYAEYKGSTYGPKSGGFSLAIKSPDTYTPAVLTLGNSGDEDLTFTVKIAKPGGVIDNPYSAKLNKEFTTKVAKGNDQGVYYQVTAPKTGYLVFECLESPKKVAEFDYVMQNLSTNAQRTIAADGNEEGTMVSIKVTKGQKVKCWIVAAKDTSGNKYPGGTFKSKLYMSDTPVKEETEQVAQIDYAVTVTDADREPVDKVSLSVDVGSSTDKVITTDAKGVAHIKLVPGDYPVVLNLPDGYTAETTELTLTEDRPYASIKLDKVETETVDHTVTVTDEKGNPLAGVTVMIGTQMKITGADGKVTFSLSKGTHTVTIVKADGSIQNQTFAAGETEMTIVPDQSGSGNEGGETEPDETEPEETEPEETEPVEKTTYSVKVVDFSGNAQSGVMVQFLEGSTPVGVQLTNSSGVATVDLAAGNYKVALVGDQLYYDSSAAVLTASQPSIQVRVTGTIAKNPIDEWFGTTYTVGVGATYVKVKQSNVNTFFAFEPTQEGIYRISVTNSKAKLQHYGSINFPNPQSIEGATSTSYELNVKENNLGGTYAICVTGATEYILVIERISSAILDENDIPWEEYEGNPPTKKHTETVSQKMTYVDLTGNTKAVLGSDGYYHLNSATGKILFVNLGPNARYISMYNMLGVSGVGGTKFGKTFRDSSGNVTVKEDYTSCMIEYVTYRSPQNASNPYEFEVYPLTEDLMYMLKNGGEHIGWWDPESENFLFADLGSAFNPDLGWMFAVCY